MGFRWRWRWSWRWGLEMDEYEVRIGRGSCYAEGDLDYIGWRFFRCLSFFFSFFFLYSTNPKLTSRNPFRFFLRSRVVGGEVVDG